MMIPQVFCIRTVCACTNLRRAGQTLISGMGELHLEITADRLQRDHGVEVTLGLAAVITY